MPHIRNVLSLFDGISCGRIALDRAGVAFDKYYSSEIDSRCIEVANHNYPDTVQIGDVNNWRDWDLKDIDLIMGGSPCQGFSSGGKELGFADPRSRLFFIYVDILKHYEPKFFLLENVVMKPEWVAIITDIMGVEPVLINSNKVTPQNRKRLYWSNLPIDQPEQVEYSLKSIVTDSINRPASIIGRRLNERGKRDDYNKLLPITQCLQVRADLNVMPCLTTVTKDTVLTTLPHGRYVDCYASLEKGVDWRYLTPIECERLQTIPDDFTITMSNSARHKACGNGWTVDVIAHILSKIHKWVA